ncbi:MAG TPA: IS1 family transposase [Cyclobacteriaceae bacterium]|nr:IS1 family transposase [Cyclobacteriaceae bacterium]
MENLKCNRCDHSGVKNGRSKTGVQRYQCRGCKKYWQGSYTYKACERNISEQIFTLKKESCGVRSISRILRISIVTVIRRIKRIGQQIQRPSAILKGKEYEVDELRTYIGNKGRLYWVVCAMRRDTKEIIDFKVGKRNLKTLSKVITTVLLSEARKIYTEGYYLYRSLIPKQIHGRSKYQINGIERKNLSIRTHLKRLSRKTICSQGARRCWKHV